MFKSRLRIDQPCVKLFLMSQWLNALFQFNFLMRNDNVSYHVTTFQHKSLRWSFKIYIYSVETYSISFPSLLTICRIWVRTSSQPPPDWQMGVYISLSLSTLSTFIFVKWQYLHRLLTLSGADILLVDTSSNVNILV